MATNTLAAQLFHQLGQLYGAQKMASMWSNTDPQEVAATWNKELSRFSTKTIHAAYHSWMNAGSAWPPTLPEFIKLCRENNRPEHSDAAIIAAKAIDMKRAAPPKTLRSDLEKIINVRPSKMWAKRHLARLKSGERYLNPAQVRMVCDALRMSRIERKDLGLE